MAETYLVYNKSKRHRLGEGICVLGRDPECCDIAFDDQELSRKHIMIVREGARYVLIDFRSTNGVMVNDRQVEQVHLKSGDKIRMGQQMLQFLEENTGGPGDPTSQGGLPRPARPTGTAQAVGAGALTSILDLKALGSSLGKNLAGASSASPAAPPADPGNLAMKLAKLIKVGRDLNSELKLKDLMEKVIDSALQVMRADRGLLMLLDEASGSLVPTAQRDMESIMQQRDARGQVSRSIVELATTSKEAVLVKDALADQRFQTSLSIQMYNIRSALCVPLINRDKFLGVLYVDNRIESFSFSEEDKELLMAFADQAAIGLENAKLVERIKAEAKRTENLSRYLSRPIVKKILEHGGDLQLGGEKVLCTVLFADIRGFTSYSENREPHQVVEFLNDFLTKMTRIIFDKNGTLDKYLGDGLMAIFGAPFHMSDAPYWAVRSALEMQACMARYQQEWEQKYGFTGRLGIGINTGEVTSGSIGSPDRMDYTVIGDSVNLGARLQAMAVKSDIVISEDTYKHVQDRIQVEPMGTVQVKGRQQQLDVFRILGLINA